MKMDQRSHASVAYLVHDLEDAAVKRRVQLFLGEGCTVAVGGFRRRAKSKTTTCEYKVEGQCPVLELGRTHDARFGQRVVTVLKRFIFSGEIQEFTASSTVIVARNLEMLLLAWRVRLPKQRLVYECLDIHRMMIGGGVASSCLRWIERKLLSRADLLLISSPAFVKHYFQSHQGYRQSALLAENKAVSDLRSKNFESKRINRQYTWRIGWFGMLRCRKTLEILSTLVQNSAGGIEVIVAGIPSPAEFLDFEASINAVKGMQYQGVYQSSELQALYASVDFIWAIDYFEEGGNSDWLLPNRLYEGLANGVVPIALGDTETGHWLERNGVGWVVRQPERELLPAIQCLDEVHYTKMCRAIASLDSSRICQTPEEKRRILAAIIGSGGGT